MRAGRIAQLRSGLSGSSSSGLAELNVTPLIDVVMCLIIFFLLVGRLSHDQTAIDLPQAGFGQGESSTDGIVITAAVDSSSPGRPPLITIDGTAADPAQPLAAQLITRIKLRYPSVIPNTPATGSAPTTLPVLVQLRADKALPFASIEPILQACSAAGIPGVKLIAERPS